MAAGLILAFLTMIMPADREARRIKAESLIAHVEALCAESMRGRMALNSGALKAARYIADAFREAGLEPLAFDEEGDEKPGYILEQTVFIDTMDKDVDPEGEERVYQMSIGGVTSEKCPLVLGLVPGRDSELKDEIVLVTARYDGQGWDGTGALFPGADRNASGVAALLETARVLAGRSSGVRRTVAFAALPAGEEGVFMRRREADAEYERLNHLVVRYIVESGDWDDFLLADLVTMPGLAGADAFIAEPPFPLERIHAVVDLNMLGGPFALDAESDEGEAEAGIGTAVAGGETGEGLAKTLEKASKGAGGRTLFYSFEDMEDRGLKRATEAFAFRKKRIPSLWVTTGPRKAHGGAGDVPDAIEAGQLVDSARLSYLIIRTLANELDSHPFADG